MRHLFVLGLAVLIASTAWAHPSVSIVKDRRGFVFYSDLKQVWQIDPTGRRSIAVPNVHSHELAIDSAGNLIGEEVRSLSDGSWEHRVWRRNPEGRLSEVVPWTKGFFQDYGLQQDGIGSRYWVTCPERRCVLTKQLPSGQRLVLGNDAQFKHPVSGLAVASSGVVYFADGPEIRRIDDAGAFTTVASGLEEGVNQNGLMGVHLAPDGSLYVAAPGHRAVMRIGPDGSKTVAASSPAPWAPSGAMVEQDGTVWLLEFDPKNEVRVRRIRRDGTTTFR